VTGGRCGLVLLLPIGAIDAESDLSEKPPSHPTGSDLDQDPIPFAQARSKAEWSSTRASSLPREQ
jgi:hypothetical protein